MGATMLCVPVGILSRQSRVDSTSDHSVSSPNRRRGRHFVHIRCSHGNSDTKHSRHICTLQTIATHNGTHCTHCTICTICTYWYTLYILYILVHTADTVQTVHIGTHSTNCTYWYTLYKLYILVHTVHRVQTNRFQQTIYNNCLFPLVMDTFN